MRLLLTGASGMLGQDIKHIFEQHGHTVLVTDRAEVDITSVLSVQKYVAEHQPDAIINTAAYNFVDKVEDPEIFPIAYAINAEGPRILATTAKEKGIPFIHFSTDYVFDGTKKEGYTEHDTPSPISQYGITKYEGERAVQTAGGQYAICRLSKLFGKQGTGEGCKESFVSVMLRLAKDKPQLQVVDEEIGCPTYTPDVAEAVYHLLTNGFTPGIYHMINEGTPVTWYGFVNEFFALQHVTTPVIPVPSSAFPKPAKRPAFAALVNTKLPKLPTRIDALRRYFANT